MYVWTWLLTGLLAGGGAHLALARSRFGVGGDLALGALGAVLACLLLRAAGLLAPAAGGPWQFAAALVGALALLAVAHGLARRQPAATRPRRVVADGVEAIADGDDFAERARAGLAPAGLAPAASPPPVDRAGLLRDSLVGGLSEVERSVLGKFLNRETVVRDVEREHQERKTFGERATDRIAAFGGSWAFLGLFSATLAAWMTYNVDTPRPFDPYPFILLNLGLSCIAAVQAPIILMSQNRQAHKDRLNAAADYEVNMKAEMEILALHEKLDELREKAWRDLLDLQQRQIEMLRRIEESAARAPLQSPTR